MIDPTGNRRFLPVEVRNIDFNITDSINREKMISEAMVLLEEGYCTELTERERRYLRNELQKFEAPAPGEDTLLELFEPAEVGSGTKNDKDIYAYKEGELIACIEHNSKEKVYRNGFSSLLRKHGFRKVPKTTIGGKSCRNIIYVRRKLIDDNIYNYHAGAEIVNERNAWYKTR